MNEPFELSVVLSRSGIQRQQLEEQWPALERSLAVAAEMVADAVLRRREQLSETLIDALLQGVALTPLDQRRARMTAEAIRDIFRGTEWLTAEEAGEQVLSCDALATAEGAVPSTVAQRKAAAARVNRWKHEGRLFALQRDNRDWYARYQFDPMFRPQPAMADVLKGFKATSPMLVASWMESPNSYLAGQRPRELLATEPERVLHAVAARQHGGLHG